MRSLVTGGAGFVGSHLVEALLARGDEVLVVDDLSTGRAVNLRAADPTGRARFVQGDLRDVLPTLLDERPFDEVYHLAAAVGVDLVMHEPVDAIEINVEATSMLLRFAAGLPLRGGRVGGSAAGAPRASRVLITSSSEVYGRPTRQVFSEDDDVVYGPTTVTRWSYAYAKAIDEHLGLAFSRSTPVGVVCVRLFNTVGPRQVGRYGMVLPRFVRAALGGEPIRVFGDGGQSRCFCDVRDVTAALLRLLGEPRCRGRVFNLGGESPVTIRELAELVRARTGARSEIVHVPYSEAYPGGYEDLQHRRPDLRRVREAIGFTASVPLARTVDDIAAWMREERDTITLETETAERARPEGRRP